MNSLIGAKNRALQQALKAGALIRSRRKDSGLTQAQFADQIGVTIPTLRRLESGDTSISLNTFLTGLAALNLTDEVLHLSETRRVRRIPYIEPKQRNRFEKRLGSRGINTRDAENAAWILSLSGQQRIDLLKKQEQEQKLCGIALR
ncbi:MAG: helix-turn-helix domain-containing protein [Mariprofundaceae bacterium]|nr:helix-turn-helix domain-containing protein [Mariprofundaceae bacterium]